MGTRGKRDELSPLLQLFIQRVNEELAGRPRSVIYRAAGGPKQKTLNDLLLNGADPSITTVGQIAHALGLPAWELFLNKAEVVRLRTIKPDNIVNLPGYPKALEKYDQKAVDKSSRDRNKKAR